MFSRHVVASSLILIFSCLHLLTYGDTEETVELMVHGKSRISYDAMHGMQY